MICRAVCGYDAWLVAPDLFEDPGGCLFHSTHDEHGVHQIMNDFRGPGGPRKAGYIKSDKRERPYVDYKTVDELRRLMTPNGKIYSRKRLGTSAREQRLVAKAIKRARYMALLPFTNATL